MERDDLLHRIRTERALLDDALSRVPDDRMLEPADGGTWTGKDHLAHLASWQRVALARVTGTAPEDIADVVRGEYTEETIDAINARFHEQWLPRTLDDVRFEFTSTSDHLIRALGSLQDDDLAREWLSGHAGRGTLAQTIEANTSEHYPDHLRVFERLAGG